MDAYKVVRAAAVVSRCDLRAAHHQRKTLSPPSTSHSVHACVRFLPSSRLFFFAPLARQQVESASKKSREEWREMALRWGKQESKSLSTFVFPSQKGWF